MTKEKLESMTPLFVVEEDNHYEYTHYVARSLVNGWESSAFEHSKDAYEEGLKHQLALYALHGMVNMYEQIEE